MTKEELFEIIDENDGELVFEDGCAMTDWSGGRFCLYLQNQQFGEGKVCDFKEALEFYKNHTLQEDNTMGGRGSGGAGGARGGGGSIGGATPQITNMAKQIQSELGSVFSLSASYTDKEKEFTTYRVSYNGNPKSVSVTIGMKRDGSTKIAVDGELKRTVKSAANAISPKKRS